MPDNNTPAAPATQPAAVPAAAALDPKVGQIVCLTEEVKRGKGSEGTVVKSVFLVTGVASVSDRKKDAKGNFLSTFRDEKQPNGQIKKVQDFVWEATTLYSGVVFSENTQFPTPRKGVPLSNLSALEA